VNISRSELAATETIERLEREAIGCAGPFFVERLADGSPIIWHKQKVRAPTPRQRDYMDVSRVGDFSTDTSRMTKAQQASIRELHDTWNETEAWRAAAEGAN
jgi:hypothetical protein